ncbi:hypothetical protein HYX11_02155 [Candidatus Woesearchaeota archaeon]|nr:hypothetical protein [Candidatus Woesearchaeota archaeon]
MVQFGSGKYFQPMEREYYTDNSNHGFPASESRSTNDVNVGIGELGMSMALGPVPNVQAVSGKLRAGTKTVELGFFGTGKGSAQGHTPEFYGHKQRQALAELSTANKVHFTTHATVGVQGLAGMTQQGFSKSHREMSISEIRRAIEFAADVSKGGTVVVHTGEFQRPLADADWNLQDDQYKGKFKSYIDEDKRSTYWIVDDRTGNIIQEAKKNREVARPVWKRYNQEDELWKEKKGEDYKDVNGEIVRPGDYLDQFGNKIEPKYRVPRYNKDKGEFEIKPLKWEDMEQEAKEMTQRAREFWGKNKGKGEDVWKKDIWWRFKDVKSLDEVKIRPEEAYVIASLETNAANSRGWAMNYGSHYQEHIDSIRNLSEQKKKIEDGTEKNRINNEIRNLREQEQRAQNDREKAMINHQLNQLEEQKKTIENPEILKEINNKIEQNKRAMIQAQEGSSSQWAQAAEAEEQIRHVVSAQTYALKESFEGYSDAALTTYRKSQQLAKEGKLTKPLAIAMENLFPESYGSHPDELYNLVQGSRQRMAERLQQDYGMDTETAKQTAEKHIVATFDTGHLNIWRKHWQGDSKKTIEQNDKEFEGWMLDKIKRLVQDRIIGHIHLADNFGYQDDHIAPGEGNTPIKEFIKILKENNYKGEMIIEPGADYYTDTSGFNSVMKAWRHFGSPVGNYGTASGTGGGRRTWSQVNYGYFGQTQPPYFTFGSYSPSEDWTLWSGSPLE